MRVLIFAVTAVSVAFVIGGCLGKTRAQNVPRTYEKEHAADLSDTDLLPLLPPRILQSIGLDSRQEQQVSQIAQNRQSDVKAAGDRVRKASCALDLAVLSDQVDGAVIDRLKKDLVMAQANMSELRVGVHQQLQALLTPEQIAQFNRLNQERLVHRQTGGGFGSPLVPFLRIAMDEIHDLSSAQLRRIDQVLASHSDELFATRRRSGMARHSLDEAAMTNPVNLATVNQKQQEYTAAQAEHADQRAKMLKEVRDVLNQKQLAKLRKIKSDNCDKEQPY